MKTPFISNICLSEIDDYLALLDNIKVTDHFVVCPKATTSTVCRFEDWYNKHVAEYLTDELLGIGFNVFSAWPDLSLRWEWNGDVILVRVDASHDADSDLKITIWHSALDDDDYELSPYVETAKSRVEELKDWYIGGKQGKDMPKKAMSPIEKAREYLARNSFDSVTKDASQWRRPLLINGESYKGTISIDNNGMCSVTISNDKGYTVFRDAMTPYSPEEAVKRMNVAVADLDKGTAKDRIVPAQTPQPPLDLTKDGWEWSVLRDGWLKSYEMGWTTYNGQDYNVYQDQWVLITRNKATGKWQSLGFDSEEQLDALDWSWQSKDYDSLQEAVDDVLENISYEEDENCIS